jgi:hypothetical protein
MSFVACSFRFAVAASISLAASFACQSGASEPAHSPPLGEGTSDVPPVEPPPSDPIDAGVGGDTAAEPPSADATAAGGACSKNEDCVPASCCHPSSCVPRASAPACGEVMCTMECRSKTLDCGGRCLCEAGRCSAKLNDLGGAPVQ